MFLKIFLGYEIASLLFYAVLSIITAIKVTNEFEKRYPDLAKEYESYCPKTNVLAQSATATNIICSVLGILFIGLIPILNALIIFTIIFNYDPIINELLLSLKDQCELYCESAKNNDKD